jgi:hypothetical protein
MELNLSDVHDCPECKGKIVCISIDHFGNTYCCYCNCQVNYKLYYNKAYKDKMYEFINNNLKRRNKHGR